MVIDAAALGIASVTGNLAPLDEPSEGLAPLIVQQMARTIGELKREGLSVLLCEQNLHFARQVADRAYVIEKGHVRRSGTMDEIEEEYQAV